MSAKLILALKCACSDSIEDASARPLAITKTFDRIWEIARNFGQAH